MPVNMISSVLVLTALLVAGCGPSLRRTHQSDNAFERCFDMDYNPAVSVPEKEVCWSTWRHEHVFNQPPDKLAYADLRLEELGEGVSIPGPPGQPGSFHMRPVPPKAEDVEVPVTEAEAPAQDEPAPPQVAPVPQAECEAACKTALGACRQQTEGDDGVSVEPCEAAYKQCMLACFSS